jgi:hypothetical protein
VSLHSGVSNIQIRAEGAKDVCMVMPADKLLLCALLAYKMKPFRAAARQVRAPAAEIFHIISVQDAVTKSVDECCCWRKNYLMMDYPFHLRVHTLVIWRTSP